MVMGRTLWANNDDGTVYMQGHLVICPGNVPLMVQPPQPQMIQQIKMEDDDELWYGHTRRM